MSKIKTVGKWAFVVVSIIAIALWVVAFVSLAMSEPEVEVVQATPCDEVIKYEDNTAVCEIFIAPSAIERVRASNSVLPTDRY